jgi:hypothetical protein
VRRVAAAGRLRVSEPRAVAMIQAAGIGTIQTILATPTEQRDRQLPQAMWNAVLAQILTDQPGSLDGGPMPAAVTFRAIAPQLTMLSDAERQLLDDWLARVIAALDRLPSAHINDPATGAADESRPTAAPQRPSRGSA